VAGAQAGASRDEAVQAVLDQREAAISSGDRAAFMATVDPTASADFRQAQGRLFDGLRSVPLAKFELKVRTDEVPDLSTGLAARYQADEVFLPPVEARYRLEGVDRVDALDGFFWTFLRRDGQWRIVADNDLKDLGLPSARNLWDFGPIEHIVTDHFTVLFDPGDRDRARLLSRLAEDGYARLVKTFTEAVPEQVVIVLPHSPDQLRQIIQATFDLSNFVAFAATSVDRDAGWESTAPRVFAQDANLSRSATEFQLQTLHHEFIHVAAFPLAGPFVPNWIHEGVADWMATGEGRSEEVEGSDGLTPDDYEFTTGGNSTILGAYDESTSAIAFLAKAKGRRAPLDLMVAAGKPRVAPGTSDYYVDRAIRKVYGASLTQFEKDWAGD
jgi:hypothetical protein